MATRDRLTIEAVQRVSRISDAQLSPDGRNIAFVLSVPDLEKNRLKSDIWILEWQSGVTRQLTYSDGRDVRPRWSPDSKSIAFLSDRSCGMQLWLISTTGGEARQLTRIPTDIDSFIWSPDGRHFAAISHVYPDCANWEENEQRKKLEEKSTVKMKSITTLPFRRWDSWMDDRRSHIFLLTDQGDWVSDLTPGQEDSPAWSEGGPDGYAFSPDGQEICFGRIIGNEALDGRKNLFTVSINGDEPRQITFNQAYDFAPRYSPDGRYIGYLATTRPLLDGDHAQLSVFDRETGESSRLTNDIDHSVSDFVWSSDSETLWFTIEENAREIFYQMSLSTRKAMRRGDNNNSRDLSITPDGRYLLFTGSNFTRPAEIFQASTADMTIEQVSHINDEWVAGIEWGEVSLFEYKGWQDETISSWLVTPPNFSPDERYPLLLLIHGGPHNAWGNNFHYRWNPQVFAAAGYVVISPNFHGSSSYGQAFSDRIRGDWGGVAYEDLMKAVDEAIRWSFVDRMRLAAAGASYGGYMANWIAGHTDRFRSIVSHDGLFNLVTSLYTSDFAGGIMEEQGATPWENIERLYEASPSTYARNFKTPMLIIHGQLDYRVDVSEGLAIFQVLKAKGVPAKLLYFPDENHWVLKPANSVLWHNHVIDWLNEWIK